MSLFVTKICCFPFFQPELYKKELVRQSSNDSSVTSELEYCGKLHFALRYDNDIEGLIVKVRKRFQIFFLKTFTRLLLNPPKIFRYL